MNNRKILALSLTLGLSFAAIAGATASFRADRLYGAEPSYVECGDIVFGTGKYAGEVPADDAAGGSKFTSTFVAVESLRADGAYAEADSAVRIGAADGTGGRLEIDLNKAYRIDKIRVYCYAETTAVFALSANDQEAMEQTCDWTDIPDISGVEGEKSLMFTDLGGADFEYSSSIAIDVSEGPLYLCKLVFTILDGGTEPVVSSSSSSSEGSGSTSGSIGGDDEYAFQKAVEAFDLTMGAKGFLSAKSEAAAGPDGEVVTVEMRLDIEATYQRGSDVAFASSVIQTTSMGDKSMTSGLSEGPYFRDERGLSYREGHKMDGTVERFYDVPFPSFDSAYMSPFSILTVRDLIFVEDGVFRLPKGIASAISYAFIDQVCGGPAINRGPDEMLLYLDGERFSRVEYEIPYPEMGAAYVASFDLSYEDEVEAISHLDDLSGLEPTEDSIRLEKAFEALSSPIAFDIEWGSGDVTSYYRGENAVYFDYHGEPRYYAPMKEGDELLYPYYGEPGFGEFDTNSPVSIDRLVPNGNGINTTLFSPVDGKASTYRIEGSDLAEAVFDLLVPADVLSFYLGGLEAVEVVLNDDGTLDMVDFLSSSSSHVLIRYRQYEGMPSGYEDSPILNIELRGLSNFLDSLVEGPDGIAYTVKSPFLEGSLSLYLTERSLFLEGNGRKSWYTAVEGMDGIQELDLHSGTPVITGASFDSMDHLLPGFFVDKNPMYSFFPISKSAYESDSIDAMSFLFPAPQVLNDMGFNVYDVVSLKMEIDASNNSFIISGQDESGTTIVDVYGEKKQREDGLDDSVPYPLPDKEG